jgi:hypothetical protein
MSSRGGSARPTARLPTRDIAAKNTAGLNVGISFLLPLEANCAMREVSTEKQQGLPLELKSTYARDRATFDESPVFPDVGGWGKVI